MTSLKVTRFLPGNFTKFPNIPENRSDSFPVRMVIADWSTPTPVLHSPLHHKRAPGLVPFHHMLNSKLHLAYSKEARPRERKEEMRHSCFVSFHSQARLWRRLGNYSCVFGVNPGSLGLAPLIIGPFSKHLLTSFLHSL